jgi:hypothetical protein
MNHINVDYLIVNFVFRDPLFLKMSEMSEKRVSLTIKKKPNKQNLFKTRCDL